MKLKSYINTITGLQAYQLIRFGSLFLIKVLLSKSSLSIEDIGQYESFLFLAGAVSFFWLTGVIQSLLPLYKGSKHQDSEKSPELFNAAFLLFMFSLLALLFMSLFNGFISEHLNEGEDIPYLPLLLVYICFLGPTSLVEYIYLLKKQAGRILSYGLITFSLQLVVVGLPPLLGFDLSISLYGLLAILFLRLIWLIGLLRKHALFKISKTYLFKHLQLAMPLILSVFLSGSAQYVDGIIISNQYDSATFAIFRYGAQEFPIVVLLANAFSNSMLPAFSQKTAFQQSLKKLRDYSAKMMNYLFPLSWLFILVSNWLYPLVFNPEFSASAPIFNLYLLLIISRLVFPQTILIGIKRTKVILLASAFEIIVNVGLSLLFIRIFGIAGVALATVIAYFLEKTLLILYNYYYLELPPTKYIPVRRMLIFSLLTVIIYLFTEFLLF